jgi:hypothetical protein
MDDYGDLAKQAEEVLVEERDSDHEQLCEILIDDHDSQQTDREELYEVLVEDSLEEFDEHRRTLEDRAEQTLGSVVSVDDQISQYYDHDEPVTLGDGIQVPVSEQIDQYYDTDEPVTVETDDESDGDADGDGRSLVGETSNKGDLRLSTSVDKFADAVVDAPTSTTDLHEELFAVDAPLQEKLLDAGEDLAEQADGDRGEFFKLFDEFTDEFFMDSVGGSFCTELIEGLDGGNRFRVKKLVSQLGNNTYLDVRTGLTDVYAGPFAVFRGSDITPMVVVRITADLFDTDAVSRETRENVVEYLTELARGCEVRIVASGLVQTRLLQEHREILPASVIESSIARLTETPLSDDRMSLATEALANINYTDSAWDVLHVICEGRHDTAWYRELRNDPRLNFGRTRLSQCLSLLEDYELIRREGPQNDKYAIATPAGTAALDALEAQIGKQADLDSFGESPDSDGSDDGVSRTPDSCSDPCTPAASREGSPTGDAAPPEPVGSAPHWRGAASAADSLTADGQAKRKHRKYSNGFAPVETLTPWEHNSVVTSSPAGGVGFDDVPIGGVNWEAFSEWSVDRLEDKRSPVYSYDEDRDELVAGGEFHTAFQYSITLARSLLSPLAFQQILTADRLDGEAGDLDALLDGNKAILRDKRCLAYLKDAYSGEEYHDALREGIEELEDLTRKIENGNYDEDQRKLRREIMQFAHGLIGTAVGIYDLLGVDVNRLVRLPGRFSSTMDADDRRELCHFLVRASTISSIMGAYTQSRVQFEPREKKREAIGDTPEVDKDDPTGTHIGQWSIAGYGVSEFQEDVEYAFENPEEFDLELQVDEENYADFTVDIPLEQSFHRDTVFQAVRRSLFDRSMRLTQHAVSVMQAFTGSIHDVSKALFYLGSENGRWVRVDDLKYALSNLPASRILPSTSGSTKSKIVHTLILSAFPLQQTELCERADVSEASFAGWGTSKSHRDDLEAFGVIRETAAGWVVTLSYKNLEDQDLDVEIDEQADALPWYAVLNDDGPAADRRAARDGRDPSLEGAVYEAMLVLESIEELDEIDHDPVAGVVSPEDLLDRADEPARYEPLIDFASALRERDRLKFGPPPDDKNTIKFRLGPRVATLGRPPDQSGLGAYDYPQAATADD